MTKYTTKTLRERLEAYLATQNITLISMTADTNIIQFETDIALTAPQIAVLEGAANSVKLKVV